MPHVCASSQGHYSLRALHKYCNVFSPDGPKTQPSRCQHCVPWSPQSTGARPASTLWTPGDTIHSSMTQILPESSSWASALFPQAQTRVLPSLPHRGTLDNFSCKYTSESCLSVCTWTYSDILGCVLVLLVELVKVQIRNPITFPLRPSDSAPTFIKSFSQAK